MNRFRLLRAVLITISVVLGLGLLATLAIRGYGAYRLASASKRFEREVGPLSFESFVRPKVAVEKNAVTWQRPGALATVFLNSDQAVVGSLSAKPFDTWTPEETAQLEAILARNGPAIELLERARGMKDSNWEIPYEQGTTAKIPNLLAAINAAKMINARGRWALGRGDRDIAVSSVETLGALARSHEAESSLIMLLIGRAIENYQIGLVHELVTSPLATPAEFARIEASLCDADLTDAFRRGIHGSAVANAHDIEADKILDSFEIAIPERLAPVFADLIAANVIEAALAANNSAGTPVKEPLAEADSLKKGSLWWNRPGVISGGNLRSASARATATSSARDLARLAIALRLSALTGGYPAALPTVDGVPTDDPLTGGPRVYDVLADGTVELRSSSTAEIVRSISPGSQLTFEALYRWILPAPSQGALK